MRKIAWKSILITFAVSFVLGTAFGRWEYSEQMKLKWKDPESRQKWVLKKMDRELGLNREQEEKIAAILKETAPEMAAARAENFPKMDAIRQQVRTRISPLLTPAQQQKYELMDKEWQERKKKFREIPV